MSMLELRRVSTVRAGLSTQKQPLCGAQRTANEPSSSRAGFGRESVGADSAAAGSSESLTFCGSCHGSGTWLPSAPWCRRSACRAAGMIEKASSRALMHARARRDVAARPVFHGDCGGQQPQTCRGPRIGHRAPAGPCGWPSGDPPCRQR